MRVTSSLQSKVEEYGDEVFDKLKNGAHIYFCGLKGMMPGILNMLEKVAKKNKLNWETFLKELKKAGELFFGSNDLCGKWDGNDTYHLILLIIPLCWDGLTKTSRKRVVPFVFRLNGRQPSEDLKKSSIFFTLWPSAS